MDMKTEGSIVEGQNLVDLHLAAPKSIVLSAAVEEAKELIIDCPAMLEDNGGEMVVIQTLLKNIEAERKELVAPINEAHAKVMAFFKKHSEPLESALAIRKQKHGAYITEQNRIAAELQRKADEAAAAERARLAKEAAVLEAKAKERDDKLRAEAEAAIAAGNAVQAAKLKAEADARQEKAEEAAAELRMQAASTVSAVVVPESAGKVSGVSKMKDNWQAVVEDADLVPREFMVVDLVKLGAYAKAMKDSAKVAGVRFVNNAQVAVRAA